jgi:hypothetical protein
MFDQVDESCSGDRSSKDFSRANGVASRKVCNGVLPKQYRRDLVRRTHLVSPRQLYLRDSVPRFHAHLDLS